MVISCGSGGGSSRVEAAAVAAMAVVVAMKAGSLSTKFYLTSFYILAYKRCSNSTCSNLLGILAARVAHAAGHAPKLRDELRRPLGFEDHAARLR